MNSTGEVLRRARNERHLTLDEVAVRTRINRKYLAALESGDRESIPGGFFYKSFARQYAMALTTDEDNVLDAVDRCLSAEDPVAPPPPDEEVLKALAIKAEENAGGPKGGPSALTYAILLLLAMVGTSGIYIVWHRAEQAQAAAHEATPSLPQARSDQAAPTTQIVPPAQSPQQAAPQTEGSQGQPSQATPAPQFPAQASPAPVDSSQQAQAQPPAVSALPPQVNPAPQQEQTVVAPPQTAGQTQVPAPVPAPLSAEEKIAVSVSAHEPTWFSVLADGKRVFSGMIQPGQSRNFSAHEVARLKIGNASGVDVVYNGKSMGVLGGPKQVVMLFLTPETSELVKTANPGMQPGLPPQF